MLPTAMSLRRTSNLIIIAASAIALLFITLSQTGRESLRPLYIGSQKGSSPDLMQSIYNNTLGVNSLPRPYPRQDHLSGILTSVVSTTRSSKRFS